MEAVKLDYGFSQRSPAPALAPVLFLRYYGAISKEFLFLPERRRFGLSAGKLRHFPLPPSPLPLSTPTMPASLPAVLALEDGSVFHGLAFGAEATISGECVFNTSMTGYQEILTDPSYFGQIVTMTAVQIGNYGVNDQDAEAAGPKAAGFVVRELSPVVSNWRSSQTLDAYLRRHGIPGISEVDTRAITKRLRVEGAMKSCLSTLPLSDEEAVRLARSWRDMAGTDYVKDVTCRSPYLWSADDPANHNTAYVPEGTDLGVTPRPDRRFKVAAFDYGAKFTIFRKLVRHGFDVLVLPGSTTPSRSVSTGPTPSSSPTARAIPRRCPRSTGPSPGFFRISPSLASASVIR